MISLPFSSSMVPSSILLPKSNLNPRTLDPIFRDTRCTISAPPSKSASASSSTSLLPKIRRWKEGEFRCISVSSYSRGITRSAPFNKKKKKMKKTKKDVTGRVHTLPETFSYCVHKKHWLKALELFDMLREQPYYEPKEVTYIKLIGLLGKCGQPCRAHQLFGSIKEDGCDSTGLYTALIAAYCRNGLIGDAFLVLDEMKKIPHCLPDVSTYSTLIRACVNALKFELVELLYEDMAERSIMPDTGTQNIVLSGYGNAGRLDQMEKLLSSMMQSTTCKPDGWTMNMVISVLGKNGQIDIMEKWFNEFCNFGMQPQTRTFNILIGAYGKKGMYDKMSSVMQYMRQLRCPWTSSTYNNVIEVFAYLGDAKNMENTFDQMRAEGIEPDANTFCCLITGYTNAGNFHKVISCVRLAGRFQIPEDTSFYNAVISACAKAGDLVEMERVFERMKDKHCQPDHKTYSIMVEAYRKESMNEKIYYLEKEKQLTLTGDKELSKPED